MSPAQLSPPPVDDDCPDEPQPRWWGRWAVGAMVGVVFASAWLGVRDWHWRKMRTALDESLPVPLRSDDEMVDAQRNWGLDREDYHLLRLTPATYEALVAKVKAVPPATQPSRSRAKWPWPLPPDAIVFEFGRGGGSSYAFSPGTRKVYVYFWTM